MIAAFGISLRENRRLAAGSRTRVENIYAAPSQFGNELRSLVLNPHPSSPKCLTANHIAAHNAARRSKKFTGSQFHAFVS